MKLSPFFLIGFLLMNVSALAELSVEDLGKIEGMFEKYDARMREFVGMKISEEIGKSEKQVRVYVSEEIEKSEQRMRDFVKGEIAESDKQMRVYISEEIGKSQKRTREFVSDEIAKLPIRMDGLDKQQDRNFLLLLALLAFIGVVVGLPQLRERKNTRAQEEKIDAQEEKIATQQQQIASQQRQIDAMQEELRILKQGQVPSA